MQILENFLPHSLKKIIQKELLSNTFPWYYNDSVVYYDTSGNNFQFIHNFYNEQTEKSTWYPAIQPFIFILEQRLNLKARGILRIKANLLTKILDGLDANNIHQDCEEPGFVSLLYYVHDSDGDTVFFEDDKKTITHRITPKENTAVFFDSTTWHSSTTPKINKNRIVINFILELEPTC